MNATWNALENSTGEIKVSCNGERWQKAQEAAFNKIAKKVKIPGFRGGKVPPQLLKQHIDNKAVMQDAAENIAGQLFMEALDEHKIDLVARPELVIDRMSEETLDLTFKCVVKPEVKLGEYKNIVCVKDTVKVEETDIDDEIEKLRLRLAELELKENGEIEKGDTVIFDFTGYLNGEKFEGGSAENYTLEIGSGHFIPGFEEQMIGLKSGDCHDLNVTFPQDYAEKSLAGQDVVFHVDIKEIKEKVLPKVDEDLAVAAEITDVNTLSELRQYYYNLLKGNRENTAEEKWQKELMDLVISASEMSVPDIMIEDEADYEYRSYINELARQGINEEFYYQLTGSTKEAVQNRYRLEAERTVKLRLILEAIAQQEEIVVEESEVEKEYQEIAKCYQRDIEEIKKAVDSPTLELDIKMRKAMDLIITTAIK